MTRIFHIKPDWEHFRYNIDASHDWGLSGISCPVCGQIWQRVGICYPNVDLSMLPDAKRFYRPKVMSLEEYEQGREELLKLLPAGSLVLPATKFGPLSGTVTGSVPDISFVLSWHVLSERSTIDRLQARGVRGVVPAPTRLTSRRKNPPELLEWDVELAGELAPSAFEDIGPQPICLRCGYQRHGATKADVILEASIPQHVDVFRPCNGTTRIYVTETFVDAVHALELTGLTITEIEIVSGGP